MIFKTLLALFAPIHTNTYHAKRSENGAKRAVPVAVQCSGVSVSVHQENANDPV